MRYVKSVAIATRALLVACALTAGGPGLMVAAQTDGDNVQVMVCPQPSESSFTVSTPQSDSIIDEPKVTLAGTAEYISQIDFFIDGTYNHTQALGYTMRDFTSSLTVSPGTHTLRLVASDSCSQTVHEQAIVITYEPKAFPSVGTAVNTTVGGRLIKPELPELPEPVPEPTLFQNFSLPPLARIADLLDLTDPPSDGEPISPLPSAGRAALFVTGAAIALTGTYVATAATLPAAMAFVQPYRRWFEWITFAVAATLFGVVFTL